MTGERSDSERGESRDGQSTLRPSRRTVLGGLAGLTAAGVTAGTAGAISAGSQVATPTVEGPVEGGSQTGRPLTAAPHDFESDGYVEEEYFVSGEAEPIEGGLLGSIGETPTEPAEYKTRILVYRPEDPADFNGGVLAEWFNVSLQTDFPVAWPNAYDYLQRNGWAVALVSAQKVGVDDSAEDQDLVTWDPERYGDLHHPGDSYALSIFAQAIAALRGGDTGATSGSTGGGWWDSGRETGSGADGWGGGWFGSDDGGNGGSDSDSGTLFGSLGGTSRSGDGLWGADESGGSTSGSGGWWGSGGSGGSTGTTGTGSGGTGGGGVDTHPLGGLDAEYVIATGQSQSSGYINSFINEVEPDYDVVDGFLPAAGSPLNLSTDVKPTIWLNTMSEAGGGSLSSPPGEGDGASGDGLFSNVTTGNTSLEDLDVDPEILASLADQEPPEDEGLFRFWEVAGAVHVNQWLSFWAGAARRRDFDTDDPPWDPERAANYGEREEGQYGVCEYNYFPHRYTFPAALEALKDWIQEGEPAPSAPRMERTDDGLAKDEYGNAVGGIRLPPIEAPVATYEDSCDLPTGKTIRFDEETLDELYPTTEDYVSRFEAAAQQAIEDGFLLETGAEELVSRAEASPIGE